MLESWVSDGAQHWLARQRDTLRAWKAELLAMLSEAGAVVWPSVTPFVCAQLPAGVTAAALRERDIAVRDAGSFGLSGWVRLNALPPEAQQALANAIGALRVPVSSSTPPLTKGNA
jgi:histidinol-phosphate aminotransferase